jgi:hypothetical protein
MYLGLVDFAKSLNEKIDIVAHMRFVAEHKAGLDLRHWSVSRSLGGTSYELSQNGQGDQILHDVFTLGLFDLAMKPLGKTHKNYITRASYHHLGANDYWGQQRGNRGEAACEALKKSFDKNRAEIGTTTTNTANP